MKPRKMHEPKTPKSVYLFSNQIYGNSLKVKAWSCMIFYDKPLNLKFYVVF